MSNVVVEYGDYPVKRAVIKTTPTMSLKSIVDTACDKFGLVNSESFGLKLGKTFIDLSLSIRFSNIGTGSKLLLVTKTQIACKEVDIALQTEEHGRLIDKYKVSVSFWSILVSLEQKHSINLVRRSGIPSANDGIFKNLVNLGKKSVYLMPVCVFMNKEYSTIQELTETTLEKAGLTSGNGVIRLLYKFTNTTLSEMEPIILKFSKIIDVPSNVIEQEPKTSISSDSNPIPLTVAPVQESVKNVEKVTSETRMDIDKHQVQEISKMIEIQENQETKETFNRNPIIYNAPPKDYTMTRFELPDSFYELTSQEVQGLISSNLNRKSNLENAPLKTRSMREKEIDARNAKYPKTCIRVRFPDKFTLQINFLSHELVSTLYEQVTLFLEDKTCPFELYTAPPYQRLDTNVNFWKASLSPASLVYFKWKEEGREGPYLSLEWKEVAIEYPIILVELPKEIHLPGISSQQEIVQEVQEIPKSNSSAFNSDPKNTMSLESKTPKWLRLSKK